jgi:ubiquinone biosynthesis protein UbiJ
LKLIEAELNRWIGESTAARDLLARLAGTSLAVHVVGIERTVVLHADPGRLRLGSDATGATAMLRATPLDLLRLVEAGGVSAVKRTHAELSGDLEVAERFAKLLRLARPDLEDEVAKWVGDLPAHALGATARGVTAWLKRAATALRMNAAEYLQEESRAIPAPLEAQAFYADVEKLRDDVERTAARLDRIARGP